MFDGELVFAVTKCEGIELRYMSEHRYPVSLRKQVNHFRRYGPIMQNMAKQAEKRNGFAANNGVVGFRKHHPVLWQIHHLAVGFRRERMHDEIATQMVLPQYQDDIRYVPGEWNALAKYEDDWPGKIAHLHNTSHEYRKSKRGHELFKEHFQDAYANNAGNLQDWAGKGDPYMLKLRPTCPQCGTNQIFVPTDTEFFCNHCQGWVILDETERGVVTE
jgi:hypothetical protein